MRKTIDHLAILRKKYADIKYFDFDYYKHELDDIKINAYTKIPILCTKHNLKFYTTYAHAAAKDCTIRGCTICIHEFSKSKRRPFSELLKRWKTKFHDNIDYSLITINPNDNNYNEKTVITLNCLKHGPFQTTIGSRICGSGCTKCYRERQHNRLQFIKKSINFY